MAEGVRQQAITVATRDRNQRVDLETQVRAQVSRIEKVNGEDKAKLRRWIRDVATVHQHEPNIAIQVAERSAQQSLADVIED